MKVYEHIVYNNQHLRHGNKDGRKMYRRALKHVRGVRRNAKRLKAA